MQAISGGAAARRQEVTEPRECEKEIFEFKLQKENEKRLKSKRSRRKEERDNKSHLGIHIAFEFALYFHAAQNLVNFIIILFSL